MRKLVTDIAQLIESMRNPENDPDYLRKLLDGMPRGKREKHPLYRKWLALHESSQDEIHMTVPLLIRCLEWAHEDAKTDVEIHQFVEKMLKKDGLLDTNDYESFLK